MILSLKYVVFLKSPQRKIFAYIIFSMCDEYVHTHVSVSMILFFNVPISYIIQLQLSITFQKHRMCFFCTASHSRLLRYWLPVWVPWFFSFIPIFMDVSRLVLSAQSPQDIPEIRSPVRCTALLKSASHHLRDVFTKAIQGRGVVNHCLTFLEVNKRY